MRPTRETPDRLKKMNLTVSKNNGNEPWSGFSKNDSSLAASKLCQTHPNKWRQTWTCSCVRETAALARPRTAAPGPGAAGGTPYPEPRPGPAPRAGPRTHAAATVPGRSRYFYGAPGAVFPGATTQFALPGRSREFSGMPPGRSRDISGGAPGRFP